MKLKLIDKIQEIDNIKTFVFEPEKNVSWQPGQYMHYTLEHSDADDRGAERWFTIAAAPFEKNIKITTRFADGLQSSFKQALNRLNIGDYIKADGPEGDFVINDASKKYVFIAGGIGITPFYSILKQYDYLKQKLKVDLYYLSRDNIFVFFDDLETMQKNNPNFSLHRYPNDSKLTDAELEEIAKRDCIFYVSGPKSMVGYYFDKLQEFGVSPDRLKKDFFPGYQNY